MSIPTVGLAPFQTRKLAFALGLEGPQVSKAARLMTAVYDTFRETDASLVEINPLIVTKSGDLLALDAKMTFDDNALFRHPEIKEFRDLSEEDPLEIEASRFSLNYIKLDGSIGCMVNGAGLAMATMDIIKLAGGEPANFLDVGGGANAEQIRNAFKILMSDTHVKAVLINIFGGILRCDVLAEGVIAAVKELGVRVPIVIRMEGTNVEKGKQMLRDSGLNFTTADAMDEAAEKVVLSGGRISARPAGRACQRKRNDGRFNRQEHPPPGPGPDRPRGHVPRESGGRLRDDRRGRHHARQGRDDPRRLADLRHGRGGGPQDRRKRVGHLRSAGVRRRCGDGGGRRGAAVDRLHHRRHPDARHDARAEPSSRPGRPA